MLDFYLFAVIAAIVVSRLRGVAGGMR